MPYRERNGPYAVAREAPSPSPAPAPLSSAEELQILVIGAPETGKTRLSTRYTLGQFIDTGDATQRVGAHKLVDVGRGRERIRLIVRDVPCGPYMVADADGEPLSSDVLGDFVMAAHEGDYRKSLLEQSDAAVLLLNPGLRSSLEWIDDNMVAEVADAARKKYLARRVELLLDGLGGDMAGRRGLARRPRPASEAAAAAAAAAAAEKTAAATSLQGAISSRDGAPAMAADDPDPAGECEYPILVVGSMADRLEENGGDMARDVWKYEGEKLAKKFGPSGRYLEVSAKTNWNVDEAYMTLIRQVLRQRETRRAADDARKLDDARRDARRRGRGCSCGCGPAWTTRYLPKVDWAVAAVAAAADPVVGFFRPGTARTFSDIDGPSMAGSRPESSIISYGPIATQVGPWGRMSGETRPPTPPPKTMGYSPSVGYASIADAYMLSPSTYVGTRLTLPPSPHPRNRLTLPPTPHTDIGLSPLPREEGRQLVEESEQAVGQATPKAVEEAAPKAAEEAAPEAVEESEPEAGSPPPRYTES